MDHPTVMKPRRRFGWLRDLPDLRDFTAGQAVLPQRLQQQGEYLPVRRLLARAGLGKGKKLPAATDLREFCPPVEDQGELGSCTAHAGIGLLEYHERRAAGRHLDASRLFLYKVTRNLMHLEGDTGASNRATMGALVLFGAPPEEHWPYDVARFDQEPPAFCYAFAQSYQALQYYRLDPPGATSAAVLTAVKTHLAAGLPPLLGFSVYQSIERAEGSGAIPFPGPKERTLGGHSVMVAGYDDRRVIAGNGGKTTGALLVRNSWGEAWGQQGYGWLPYDYLLRGLAADVWAILQSEWTQAGEFGGEE
ncbi:MAG TPA: C1 family peptidase [Candidatus Aminicenantes bacterium]|nr:C1 family peptidase [Candidatus Aminicenantes bacterium]